MPYKTMKTDQCPTSNPWGVVNKATGKVVPGGCHATQDEAQKHLGALQSNVPDAKKSSGLLDEPDWKLT